MSSAVPALFDANAHPTVSGGWSGKALDSRFERLSQELTRNGYRGACAVGIWDTEDYAHMAFMEGCRRHPELVPIAGYFPSGGFGISRDLSEIKKMGFKGIKLHPRNPLIRLNDTRLVKTFQAAAKLDLPVFLCTYFWAAAKNHPATDPLLDIAALLRSAPGAKAVLVHGGGVELMRYAELARFNPQVLLDLSMTFMKYRGSSLDLDIRFLFEHFDRRICVGTDFPEYTHGEVRERFAEVSRGIPAEKLENIAFRNIEVFLK